MQKIAVLLTCCFFICACAKKPAPSTDSPTDFVSVTLGKAAEQAHGELAMLAKLRGQGMQPLLPPPDPTLAEHISIAWTGTASGALKEICLQIGYRYEEMGTPSAQAMTVIVRGLNRPAHKVIEDIAWQIQPQAVIRIDPISKTVTLAKTSATAVVGG